MLHEKYFQRRDNFNLYRHIWFSIFNFLPICFSTGEMCEKGSKNCGRPLRPGARALEGQKKYTQGNADNKENTAHIGLLDLQLTGLGYIRHANKERNYLKFCARTENFEIVNFEFLVNFDNSQKLNFKIEPFLQGFSLSCPLILRFRPLSKS